MTTRDIIVIGASAGGMDAIRTLVAGLPADLRAAVLIVWHMSPDVKGILPAVLNRIKTLPAAHAYDGQPIMPGQIYVAPPDRHLLVEQQYLRVTKGPKENRFRPAVDPLFRSAAYAYGPRVIGIILSGALDDGTAGLWAIKQHGGLAIAQDPQDAEVSSMPMNAIREVSMDHVLPVAEMPALLEKLTTEPIPAAPNGQPMGNGKMKKEIRIALQEEGIETVLSPIGQPTLLTCPECEGVLSAIVEDNRVRYRCHTGHAFSADSLLEAITENTEQKLWQTIRSMNESIMLLNHLGDHFAEMNQPHTAALYFQKAREITERDMRIRQVLREQEQLNTDKIREMAAAPRKRVEKPDGA